MGQGATWTTAQRESRLGKLVERNRSQHRGDHLYEDADWMRHAYVIRGLSLREMAAECGCGLRTVARWMKIHEIPTDRTRQPRRRSGPEHPNWQGGPARCPECDGPKGFYSERCTNCRDRTGASNSRWRGDAVGVASLHIRIRAERGRPELYPCEHCGGTAKQWAYDHSAIDERPSEDGPYSTNIYHYIPLCVSCHKRFDASGSPGRAPVSDSTIVSLREDEEMSWPEIARVTGLPKSAVSQRYWRLRRHNG